MTKRIRVVRPQDVIWPFHRQQAEVRLAHRFGTRIEQVDPFPGYSHDRAIVTATVAAVEGAYPLPDPFAPRYFLLPVDTPAHTNGWTDRGWEYRRNRKPDAERRWAGSIILCGKRIPPHPATTRYLVAHEFGHVVHYWIAHVEGEDDEGEALYRRYAKLRGLRAAKSYGGGTWHASTSELFANDFRILVTGVEPDYWPHPGIPRPEEKPAIVTWWKEEVARHRRWMGDRGLRGAA